MRKPSLHVIVIFLSLFTCITAKADLLGGDLNLKCGHYLVVISESLEDKLYNVLEGGTRVVWDLADLSGDRREELKFDRHAHIIKNQETIDLSIDLRYDEIEIDRMKGVLKRFRRSYGEDWEDGEFEELACLPTTRENLERLIKSHNDRIDKTGPKRKF